MEVFGNGAQSKWKKKIYVIPYTKTNEDMHLTRRRFFFMNLR